MKELVWILPLVLSISFVLGACRATTGPGIVRESVKTFTRIVVTMLVVVLVFQAVIWAIPRVL